MPYDDRIGDKYLFVRGKLCKYKIDECFQELILKEEYFQEFAIKDIISDIKEELVKNYNADDVDEANFIKLLVSTVMGKVYVMTKDVKQCMDNEIKELKQDDSQSEQNTEIQENEKVANGKIENVEVCIKVPENKKVETTEMVEANKQSKEENKNINLEQNIESEQSIESKQNIKTESSVESKQSIETEEIEEQKVDINVVGNKKIEDIAREIDNIQKEKLEDIKIQFLKDEEEIRKIKQEFTSWSNRANSVPEYVKNLKQRLENTIKEFNIKYEEKLKETEIEKDEKELKLSNSRKKGINMIEKMVENVIKNYLKSLEIKEDLDVTSFKVWNAVKELSLEELKKILNENYNIISELKRKKDGLVKKYFGFISNYILDIVDGIDSGKEISSKQENLELYKYINTIYDELNKCFNEELFLKMGITKMQANIGNVIDLYRNEPFDIEKTAKKENDEKVYQIVRNGYEYEGKLFNQNQNYVVRPAKVVVYKYDVNTEADKNEGV